MKNAALSLRILLGAFTGAFISILIGFIALSCIGILYGYDGPLLAFYYFGGLVLYVAPVGMILGVIVASIRLFRNIPSQDNLTSKNGRITRVIWIGLPLVLVIGAAIAPYMLTNVNRNVRHGATWTTESLADCATPAVILMLTEYPKYEVVCSPELLDYLQAQGESIVPITYRVTYDFGQPRSYQLTQVGPIEISWQHWLGGPSGCGGEFLPTCDSPQAQNGSPLYKSSWLGQ